MERMKPIVYDWSDPVPMAINAVNYVVTVYLKKKKKGDDLPWHPPLALPPSPTHPSSSSSGKPSSRGGKSKKRSSSKKDEEKEGFFDLDLLCQRLRDMGPQWNTYRFSSLIIRWSSIMDVTARVAGLIFPQGRIVCTGAKSLEMADYMVAYLVDRIRSIEIYQHVEINFRSVENQVASTALPWLMTESAMQAMKREYSLWCDYNKTFPGAIFRYPPLAKDAKITCLIFKSGKLVVMGMKDISQARLALELVPPLIKKFGSTFRCKPPEKLFEEPQVGEGGEAVSEKRQKKNNEMAREQMEKTRLERELKKVKLETPSPTTTPSKLLPPPTIPAFTPVPIKVEKQESMPRIEDLFATLRSVKEKALLQQQQQQQAQLWQSPFTVEIKKEPGLQMEEDFDIDEEAEALEKFLEEEDDEGGSLSAAFYSELVQAF